MSDLEVIDGEVIEAAPVETTAVVRRERRSEVMRPLDAGELVDSFHAYQELLPRLLEASDYQQASGRRFVKKSGWRKIATAFDLDVILVADEVERDENGRAIRAKVIARAIAPSGRTMDGDGYCSISESRFSSSRADLSKLENDLRTTATTRAKNRAIADLVGMGDVSAEEIGSDTIQTSSPPYGPAVDKTKTGVASKALTHICAGDTDAAEACWNAIKTQAGYMPAVVAQAIVTIANTFEDDS